MWKHPKFAWELFVCLFVWGGGSADVRIIYAYIFASAIDCHTNCYTNYMLMKG